MPYCKSQRFRLRKSSIESVPVVMEFLEVISNDLSGMFPMGN